MYAMAAILGVGGWRDSGAHAGSAYGGLINGNCCARPHLSEQAQPRRDAVIKVDEFGLCQPVDIDLHGIPEPTAEDAYKSSILRLAYTVAPCRI
jgi:hypothetical protein